MKTTSMLVVAVLAWASAFGAHADLDSLRGTAIEQTNAAPEVKQYRHDDQLIKRDFVQQPPLIPHNIEGYQINLRANKCLTCHSWANYKQNNATKISITHFRDRDGNELSNVAAARYFCTQCHVPQVDAPPLVENAFRPVDALQ